MREPFDLTQYLVCSACGKPVTFKETDYQGRGRCCRPAFWAIAWKHRHRENETGRGDPVWSSEEECQKACDRANGLTGGYFHWPVEEKDD